MGIQRVIVCEAQVPFVRGGAEYLVRTLVTQLQRRWFSAELVSIPFKWYPKDELLATILKLCAVAVENGVYARQKLDVLVAEVNALSGNVSQIRKAWE